MSSKPGGFVLCSAHTGEVPGRGEEEDRHAQSSRVFSEAGQIDLIRHSHGKPCLLSTDMDSGSVSLSTLISSFTSDSQQRGVACEEEGE